MVKGKYKYYHVFFNYLSQFHLGPTLFLIASLTVILYLLLNGAHDDAGIDIYFMCPNISYLLPHFILTRGNLLILMNALIDYPLLADYQPSHVFYTHFLKTFFFFTVEHLTLAGHIHILQNFSPSIYQYFVIIKNSKTTSL